jgi:hypothetical protein
MGKGQFLSMYKSFTPGHGPLLDCGKTPDVPVANVRKEKTVGHNHLQKSTIGNSMVESIHKKDHADRFLYTSYSEVLLSITQASV